LEEQQEQSTKECTIRGGNGKPDKLLDDIIDAKVSTILAERKGDLFNDSDHVHA